MDDYHSTVGDSPVEIILAAGASAASPHSLRRAEERLSLAQYTNANAQGARPGNVHRSALSAMFGEKN